LDASLRAAPKCQSDEWRNLNAIGFRFLLLLLAVLAKHHVEGVTIGNLMKDRAKLKHPEALRSAVKGGLSGLPAQQVTTDLIRQTYHAYRDRFVIIGVGGIFTAEDAYAKIRAGAHLVALVTALMFEGPQVVGEINEGLVRLLKKDGFSSIAEAVGADHKA
jgi:dihydroorotate dehydrogenase (fumarate)